MSDFPLGQGPLSAQEYCDALDWVNQSPSWRGPQVSVGERGIPVQFPWLGIPEMVSKAPPTKAELLHEAPSRHQESSVQENAPMEIIPDGDRWRIIGTGNDEQMRGMTRDFAERVFVSLGGTLQSPVEEPVVVTNVQPTGGSMDLGQVLVSSTQSALDALIRKELGPRTTTPAFFPMVPPAVGGAAVGAGVSEAIDYFTGTKKRRRRRKRLATVSDIKDLAALKAVLGNGEAFKTWIATHSR